MLYEAVYVALFRHGAGKESQKQLSKAPRAGGTPYKHADVPL